MRLKLLFAALLGALAAPALAQAPATPASPTPASPAPAADPENILVFDLSTGGRVSILLRPDKAPNSVERVKTLARRGFYNGLTFHRVIDGFMAQGGDPKGTGEGGSELPDLKAEFNDLPHVRGAMSMARAESPDSANSQFFIVLSPTLRLDGKYTVIGRVISGMGYVDLIEKGEPPANPSRVIKASIAADEGRPVAQAPTPAAAEAAASAAAEAAAEQAAQAGIAAQHAADAAALGDAETAEERAKAAQVAAEGAAQAAGDAAQAVEQAAPKR